ARAEGPVVSEQVAINITGGAAIQVHGRAYHHGLVRAGMSHRRLIHRLADIRIIDLPITVIIYCIVTDLWPFDPQSDAVRLPPRISGGDCGQARRHSGWHAESHFLTTSTNHWGCDAPDSDPDIGSAKPVAGEGDGVADRRAGGDDAADVAGSGKGCGRYRAHARGYGEG